MQKVLFASVFVLFVCSISEAGQPVARFTHLNYDFGVISEQDKVEHEFELSNAGDEDLLVEKIVASSGSTKGIASSNYLKPGQKGNIKMIVDLRGKKGLFSKKLDVYTNDPITPVTTLTVKIVVKDQIHMSQYHAAEIFSDNCRECHVDQGKGKKGWDLFKADCFMCHNAGKSTSLSTMSKRPAKDLLKAIREGVDNTVMPGFHVKNGGPLNDSEIDSLMELIHP